MRILRRKLTSESVERDHLDRIAFSDLASRAPRFGSLAEPDEAYPAWGALVEDLFCVYHREEEPRLVSEEKILPSHRLNRAVMAELVAREELLSARAHTRSRALEAALATMAAAGELRSALDGALSSEAEKARELASREDKVGHETGGEDNAGDDGAEHGELPGGPEASGGTIDAGAVREAVDAAAEAARDAAQVVSRLPGLGSSERRRIPLDRQIALAERFVTSPTLRRIAHLAGRLVRDMQGARARRVRGGAERPVDVVLGDDLSSLLPHEMMGLRVPALRRDFLTRLSEGSLLVFEKEGEELAAKGPVVIVVDSSGSMAGARIEWAKAVCLALIALAGRDGRDCAVVEFSTEVRSWEFRARKVDPGALSEMAGHHFGGGTKSALGMEEAARIIEGAERFSQADVVFVTDGRDAFTDKDEEIRDRLRALGVRIQGVSVESEASEYVRRMCETWTSVYELSAPSGATRHVATHLSG